MANQPPPGRQWFRLASLARMEGMEAAAATSAAPNPPRTTTPPVPRLPIPRTQQQSPPSLPPPPLQPPPPPPQVRPPTPPPQPEPLPELLQVTPTPQPEIQTRPSAPPAPPIEPPQPPESPKVIEPTPNPEPEPEPKLLLPEKPKTVTVPDVGNGTLSSVVYNKTRGSTTEKSNGVASAGKIKEEGAKRAAITMAGENTGAIMELGSVAHRRRPPGFGNIGEQDPGDGKSKEMPNEKEKEMAKPMAAVVNSNVQSINNSIVLNSSCSLQSPGVHINFASHRRSKARLGASDHEGHLPHIN